MNSNKATYQRFAIALFLGLTTTLAGCEIGNPEGGEGVEGANTEQQAPETEESDEGGEGGEES